MEWLREEKRELIKELKLGIIGIKRAELKGLKKRKNRFIIGCSETVKSG